MSQCFVPSSRNKKPTCVFIRLVKLGGVPIEKQRLNGGIVTVQLMGVSSNPGRFMKSFFEEPSQYRIWRFSDIGYIRSDIENKRYPGAPSTRGVVADHPLTGSVSNEGPPDSAPATLTPCRRRRGSMTLSARPPTGRTAR